MAATGDRAIHLRGVRVHNLKGLDLDLPRNRFVAFCGVSGSGKSSLAFDTLYAEGQRRYLETFSAYTRQFLERLDKPDADRIDGLPPAVAVSQRSKKRSARSTVGSVTEIHDALALLYARAGRVFCLDCGQEVFPAEPETVARAAHELPDRTRYRVTFPVDVSEDSNLETLTTLLREDGFTRVRVDGQEVSITSDPVPRPSGGSFEVVVDRLVRGTESEGRLTDSIETAFARGLGRCSIVTDFETRTYYRGWRCSGCGRDYDPPEPRLFRVNNPVGACPECEGFGRVSDLDLARIVPDPSKSLEQGAILPWTMPAYQEWQTALMRWARQASLPIDRPFQRLEPGEVARIVEGEGRFGGLRGFFRALERKSYKMHVRIFLSRWRGYRPCPVCRGARLKPEALAVQVGGRNVAEVLAMTVAEAFTFLQSLTKDSDYEPYRKRLLDPVLARLEYLDRIGLGYLSLDRPARTLSGGEARRVALTSALGSGLVNTLYVLDEPSTGLHPRDVEHLREAITRLRDLGNSVMVVEHEETLLKSADMLVEIGPGAGEQGGNLLFQGPPGEIGDVEGSPTGEIFSGRRKIPIPTTRRPADKGFLRLLGASGHNLKGEDVEIPLGALAVVTGVSGAGKSTLIEETLYPALLRKLRNEYLEGEPYRELQGAEALDDVVLIDQSPIGRSPRSNPVTYLKAFDEIRKAFAATHEAKLRNYGPSQFSFNVEGGRCNACEGNGFLSIDMQFLADVMMRCPECRGTRYRAETLEVTYRGKNIAEVLELSAREAFAFFKSRPRVQARLRPLLDVGLDYLRLGQPADTLSGGESQRLKLASHLASTSSALMKAARSPRTLFLLDEPTSGLHPVDIIKLLECLHALVDLGHSVLVVEHSPEVMASADWI
ncbi:MAG TPA: excinuclease ABC subunit UvrA, partial [Isosphaeraceae bacterium]|nr:excinuclease ABC subunit UvrA [Isosphaeraceae bacterium]